MITVLKSGITNGDGTNPVTTLPVDTRGANLIVLHVSGFSTVGIPTDSKGNTWTPLTIRNSATGYASRLFYCASPTVDQFHTFTTAQSISTIGFLVVSGANAVPFEAEIGAAFPSGTSAQPGSLTPAGDDTLCVAGICYGSGTGATVDSGYFIRNQDYSGGINYGGALAFLVGSSAGIPRNPTFSWISANESAVTAVVFEPAPVTPPTGVITVLKSGIATGDGGNATTAHVDTTGANLLIVHAAGYTYTPFTVTDSYGNTWTPLTLQTGGQPYVDQLFYCTPPSAKVGPGHTFNLAGYYPTIGFLAVSGAAAIPFEAETGFTVGGGTSGQPGSLTPTENGALCVAGISYGVNTGATIDSGYTIRNSDFVASVSSIAGAIAYLIQSTAAPVNPTFTWVGSTVASMKAAVFKPAPVVVTPPPGGAVVRPDVIYRENVWPDSTFPPGIYSRD